MRFIAGTVSLSLIFSGGSTLFATFQACLNPFIGATCLLLASSVIFLGGSVLYLLFLLLCLLIRLLCAAFFCGACPYPPKIGPRKSSDERHNHRQAASINTRFLERITSPLAIHTGHRTPIVYRSTITRR